MKKNEVLEVKGKLKDKIIGREKNFNAAVLVSLMKIDGKLNFVLQKRSKDIRQAGEICFPGGKHDSTDITFERTAIRETIEEMGVTEEEINTFGKIGTLVTPAGVIVEAYIGQLECTLEDINFNEDEVEKLLIIPVEFFKNTKPIMEKIGIEMNPCYTVDGIEQKFPAKKYNMNEKYYESWRGMDRIVYIYEYDNEVIWGITAEIIHEVVTNILL